MIEKCHIGKLIKKRADELRLSNVEFARYLNCHPSAINYMYKQESIDIHKLIRISKILNYDFISRHFCMRCAEMNEDSVMKSLVITHEEVEKLKKRKHIVLDVRLDVK